MGLCAIKRLAGSVWGCARSSLNTTYKMFIQPIMLYVWRPLITATEVTLKPLDSHRGDSQATREGTQPSITTNNWRDKINTIDAMLLEIKHPYEQMRSLALETTNVKYPADKWPQVFNDGSYTENQANVEAVVYHGLLSLYAAVGHNRSAMKEGIEALNQVCCLDAKFRPHCEQ
ncbi:unnamed protein product [Rodentolepis nana]|uniref:DUF4159 domain-containing protein n=1 Tax=Rodentolepis nana TaxID=102285 RepID=A0A0R3THD1_RODNA|nr:unnamed protein product [Rodentolepis nana]